MLTKFKKSFTIALAVVMCLSTVCASAATWKFKGYDNNKVVFDGSLKVAKCYEEYDDANYYTGRYTIGEDAFGVFGRIGNTIDVAGKNPYAAAELRNPWVDIYYPNAEYADVYAVENGVSTYIAAKPWATGRFGTTDKLVQYKDVDYMWEVAAPYGIYSVTKAWLSVNGVAKWFGTPEYCYPTQYTGRNAEVKVAYTKYGFAGYEVVDGKVVGFIPSKLAGYVDAELANTVGLPAGALALQKAQPTRSMIAYSDIKIPRSYDYTLVGPAFDEVGNATPYGKTILASKYESDPANFGVKPLITTVKDRETGATTMCEITWADGGYERYTPHLVYKWLVVDGVKMDGSYAGNFGGEDYWYPAIAVYTGAVASNIFGN